MRLGGFGGAGNFNFTGTPFKPYVQYIHPTTPPTQGLEGRRCKQSVGSVGLPETPTVRESSVNCAGFRDTHGNLAVYCSVKHLVKANSTN